MSIISDSRRPARQALGQVVVRLSALRFANCAPVACYGCADQALFQCSFLIYLFYYLFRSLTFQIDVEWILLIGWSATSKPSTFVHDWSTRLKTHSLFRDFFAGHPSWQRRKASSVVNHSLSLCRFSNEGNRNLKDGYSV